MQTFEILFLLLMSVSIIRLIIGPVQANFNYSTIALAGAGLFLLGGIIEGWRWQMIPAYAGFAVLVMASFKKSDTRLCWRFCGAISLMVLVGLSSILASLMPIVTLAEPAGPFGVGTFEFSIIDSSRKERYAPERNRELYVEVWYPADRSSLDQYPVRTLFHELYEGDFNRNNIFFGYLDKVSTHSYIHAPVADNSEGAFPVVLFNHALDFGFTSQNQLLMEHLASHGYVVFSIAHPFQSAKVNLAEAGAITRASNLPGDITLPREKMPDGIIGKIFNATGDMHKVSEIKSLLLPLADRYQSLIGEDKDELVKQAVNSPDLEPFKQYISEELLEDFIFYDQIRYNSLVQYWVEDNQFIADSLSNLQTPVAGFSEIVDQSKLGVIGMSFGGAVAGEFCKIDRRCNAGINLDGTQWGSNWDRKLPVPFLMFYNDEHQGGNDFTYLPPAADFWDFRIKGSAHTDFTDFVYLWPILKLVDFSGSIDGMRMMEILNVVQLNFLDHYLKGKQVPVDMHSGYPEIVMRKHKVVQAARSDEE